MSRARHLWNAFLDACSDLAEVVATLEGNDTSDIESTEIDPAQSVSSSAPQLSAKQSCGSDSEHPKATASIESQKSNATPHANKTDSNFEEINYSDDTGIESTEQPSTSRVFQGLGGQGRKFQAEEPKIRAELMRQVGDLQRQIRDLELEKVRMSEENSRATQKQKDLLQEAETRLESQKVAAEQATAAAEGRFREEILNAQLEANLMQTRIRQKDSEIGRLNDLAEEACEAKVVAIQEKTERYHAKVQADEQIERLRAQNRTLRSQRDHAESKVSVAEGRAKGLEDLLKVTEKSVERWKTAYKNSQEDARDKLLSAYTFLTPESSEENRKTFMTAPTEAGSTMAVELLREKEELDHKNRQLTAKIEELDLALEEEKRSQKARENDIRRQCGKEKEEALAKAREDIATSQQATMEQDIRRECQLEMEKLLSDEREHIRVQWTSWASSLRVRFAGNLKARTTEELKKHGRKASAERKSRSKVNKRQAKCVIRQAVSAAVEVERALIKKELRSQFQTELSNYKTRSETEHAKAQTQPSGSQNDAGSTSQITALQQEIYKRDREIESEKQKTKQAHDEKRQSEADHRHVREENERLSRRVMAYESQESLASQSTSEPRIALMAQDSVRASKLMAEVATMGLDEFHLEQLNELLSANKLISDLRSTIEEDHWLDREAFQDRITRLMLRSNGFDALDPRERPALHAQLEEAYRTVVSLSEIMKPEAGDGVKEDLLERIYRDKVKGKGKGKGKGKQGASFSAASGAAASVPSSASSNGAQNATPSSAQGYGNNTAIISGLNNNNDQQHTRVSNTTAPPPPPTTTTQHAPNVPHSSSSSSSLSTPNPNATQQQSQDDGPEDIDSATAHALLDLDLTDSGTAEPFDLDSIDWTDPTWRNLDVEAESFTGQISSIESGKTA